VYVEPNTPVKLLVLLPGETADPGSVPGSAPFSGSEGKSDWTPDNQTAGVPFTITVQAVDNWWNVNTGTSPTVQLTSTDSNADLSDNNKQLTNGATTFAVIMKTANMNHTITATNTDGSLAGYESSSVYIQPNTPTRLRIIVPGQTRAPGTAGGKTGPPNSQTAGVAFTLSVDACDNWWNTNSSTSPTVSITTEDPNDTEPANRVLINGTTSFVVTFKTANTSWTITASDISGTLSSTTTAKIIVNPAPATKLLVLVPNESYEPGTPTGKSGSVINQTAGEPFTITVYATDNNWNINTSANPTVQITTEDPYDIEPANKSLVNGTTTFAVTLVRAWSSKITAQDTSATLESYTTPSIKVDTNTATKLLVLVPGVSHEPGEWSGAPGASAPYGRTGSPSAQIAGISFNVTVMAVDNWWNRNYSNTNIVKIWTQDPYDDLYGFDPPAPQGLSNGMAVFSATLVTNDPTGVGNQWKIYVSTNDGSNLSSDESQAITVQSGSPAKLQVLLPGEDTAPGTISGREGTVSTQIAGVEFTITVNSVDDYWNFVSNPSPNPIETSDPYDEDWGYDPTNQQLSNGTRNFTITMVTEGDWEIYAYDTDYTYEAGTSSVLHVKYGNAARCRQRFLALLQAKAVHQNSRQQELGLQLL